MTADDALSGAPRWPVAARAAVFVAVVAAGVAMVAVVLARTDHPPSAASDGPAATVELPADDGTSRPVPPGPVVPPGEAAGTTVVGPATSGTVAQRLEVAIRRRTGFIHKVSCYPAGPVASGDVLSCGAATEPPVAEVAPSQVLAVVGEDGRTVVWAQGTSGPLHVDALEPDGLSCAELRDAGFSWVAALAYWEVQGRPDDLAPDEAGRPCADVYPAEEVERALAAAV